MVNLLVRKDLPVRRVRRHGRGLKVPGVYVHLYAKPITKPFRKMGHVTIVDDDAESLKRKPNL